MNVSQYVILFVFVAIMGAGLPGPGDASLIAAGTLAGDGTLKLGIVLATAMVAWMLGSVIGFAIGIHGGRRLLDHPGRLEKTRGKLLAKGDRVFGRHNFTASVTMPAFVSGIFRVRVWVFVLGALVAGVGWIGMYVGISYFLGEEVAKRIGNAGTKVAHQRDRDRHHRTMHQGRVREVARDPARGPARARCPRSGIQPDRVAIRDHRKALPGRRATVPIGDGPCASRGRGR